MWFVSIIYGEEFTSCHNGTNQARRNKRRFLWISGKDVIYGYNCRNPRNCHYVLALLSVQYLYIWLYIPNIYTECSTFFFIKISMGINKKINVTHNRGCLKLYWKIIWKRGMWREQYLSFNELTKSLNFPYMGNFERRKYIV